MLITRGIFQKEVFSITDIAKQLQTMQSYYTIKVNFNRPGINTWSIFYIYYTSLKF